MQGSKRKIVLGLVLLGVVLVSAIAGTFAYFTSTANNDRHQTANLSTGTMALTFEDNDNGINTRLMFGESVTKKFKIINTGTLDASMSLDWNTLVNTYMNGSLSYNLKYSETEDGEYKEVIPETNMPVSSEPISQTLAPELSVPSRATYYYNLTITLNNLEGIDQADDVDAYLNTKFSAGDPLPYRYYILSVDPNGGEWNSFSEVQNYNLKNNETKEIDGTPTRTGHTFLGWKVTGLSSTLRDNVFTMGIGDTKLIAQWNTDKYNLTLNLDGGTYTGTQPTEIEYGSTIDLSIPTKTGYTFAGWETTVGEVSDDNTKFTMTGTTDVVITAKWTVNTYEYKVIHRQMNVDGNGYTEVDTETNTLAYGETITPEVKTYEGFTSPSAKTITINTTGNTVTYDYTRTQYTLTINPDGGSYSGNTSVTMYYGASMTINDATGKTGHRFTGWNVSKGTLSETKVYTMAAGNATLTAEWVPNNYKYIVYHKQMTVDGTSYETVTDDTESGEKAFGTVYTPNTKSYTGFTSPAKQSLTIQVDSEPLSKNVVNYQYTRNQSTLTIDTDGGTYNGSNPGKMYYGASVVLGTPTKTGYTFSGWTKTAGSDSVLSSSTFTMGTSNSTVKATYTPNKYAYTVKHMKQNANDSGYTLAETEEKEANFGTSVTPGVKIYTGFNSPSTSSITIQVDTTKNVIEYKYNRQTFTLTINPNGGSYNNSTSNTTATLKYQQTYTLATPVKTGYSYTWSKTGTGAALSGSTFTMGTSNASVTASWTANKYTVTFNANGGKIGSSTTSTAQATYNAAYGNILPTPTYSNKNYIFQGWFTEATGGTQVTSTTIYTTAGNATLYAHWKMTATPGTSATLKALNITSNGTKSSFASVATTNEGVFEMADDYGTSYYYRGAVTNNYVKFGGFFWRIIRVNGDGSIRMIYDGTQAYANAAGGNGSGGADRFIQTGVVYNGSYNDNAYVGWMYGTPGSSSYASTHTVSKSSTEAPIKKNVVDPWYKTNIADKGLGKYVSDEIFCNDRSTASSSQTWWTSDTKKGFGKNATAYGAFSRFLTTSESYNKTNPSPKFTCTQKNDAFTVSDTTKGNGSLLYPVGLITADEIVAAGAVGGQTNKNYYLFKNNSYWYWSLSPGYMDTYGYANVFSVNMSGSLGYAIVGTTNRYGAVAPVINLSAETAATLVGSGTTTSPYQVPGVA